MPVVSPKFSFAVDQHRAGNLGQAEALYREVIACDPNAKDPHHADALHLLGLIASEAGYHEAASALIVRAIEIGGPAPLYCVNLGIALGRQGKFSEAAACFRQALEANPGDGKTHARLGSALLAQGRLREAAESFRSSLRSDPRVAETHFELGNALHAMNSLEEAAQSYLAALACEPAHAEASHNLGVTRTMQHRPDDAIAAYERAIHIRPHYPEPHNNLGTLMQALGRDDRAIYHYGQALRFAPDSLEVRYNLALLDQERERLEEAAAGYRELLGRKPDHAEAQTNLGNTLLALNRPGEAIRCYRQTLTEDPESVEGHWNLGLANLLLGRFEEGWKGHEWRFRQNDAKARVFPQPMWDGSPLGGRSILLHCEQGLGDTLQFVRYAPLVKQRGGRVILECQEPLYRLLTGVRGVDRLISSGRPLPPFDCHAPLLSLPGIFQTALDTIPAKVPYIRVGRAEVGRWRRKIEERMGERTGLKVGLTWAGNPRHKNDRNRSLASGELGTLAGLDQVVFFGLQKAPAKPSGLETIDLLEPSADFLDTAAILLNLDLLISVDTSVAHLAGALGKPVRTLLPTAPDWRWMLGRADSPWYPSMKLYRQTRRKDWSEALERLRAELEQQGRRKA
jgi:tetratricopeptide (TPR) repeat protein